MIFEGDTSAISYEFAGSISDRVLVVFSADSSPRNVASFVDHDHQDRCILWQCSKVSSRRSAPFRMEIRKQIRVQRYQRANFKISKKDRQKRLKTIHLAVVNAAVLKI